MNSDLLAGELGEGHMETVEKSLGRAPKPPEQECTNRIERVRRFLSDAQFDALLVFGSAGSLPEPARYLAGYVHVFPTASSFLLIPVAGDPLLLIDQGWHLDEARSMSWIQDIRVFPNANRRWLYDEMRTVLHGALRERGLERARIAIVESELPVVYWRALREAAPAAMFEEGKLIWERIVATPSEYDQAMVRRTAQIADLGHAAAVEAADAGVPEFEVCFAAYRAMASLGAEFLHGSGFSTHVNIGSFSQAISNVRPFLFTSRRLEPGQMFWFDLTCSWAGYYNDCCRTIAIGEPTPERRRIFDICLEMYETMLQAVRPGVPGGEIWTRGYEVAERARLADKINHVYLGHTTGIATSVRPVIARGEIVEIQPNSFVNIEPGIFLPGVGSASIESMLWVGESETEVINQFSVELHVK